jgi:hypothetical protein
MEKENLENKVIQLNALSEMRDAVVFETAWTYHTMKASKKQKEQLLDCIKVVWNRSLCRAGYPEYLMDLGFNEEDVKKVLVEVWGGKSISLLKVCNPDNNTTEDQNHD